MADNHQNNHQCIKFYDLYKKMKDLNVINVVEKNSLARLEWRKAFVWTRRTTECITQGTLKITIISSKKLPLTFPQLDLATGCCEASSSANPQVQFLQALFFLPSVGSPQTKE